MNQQSVVILLSSGKQAVLTTGHEYIITYQFGNQRYPRMSRMSFLGETLDGLQFNARPKAGTQSIPDRGVIITVEDVGASKGRDDPLRYVARDARFYLAGRDE